MRPINRSGKEWAVDTSNLAFRDIRRRALADLRDRDEARSEGRMCKANGYALYTEQANPDRGLNPEHKGAAGTTFVVDPVLVAMRHSGDDELALIKSRWGDFCATPRDEKPYVERIRTCLRDDRLAIMRGDGAAIEATLPRNSEATGTAVAVK